MKDCERERLIARTSALGIVTNLLIAGLKLALGLLTSSIAIASEGVNNATDALTSVLTLVGAKLACKHPDAKHPFGYGRIEYLTALVIATLILISGVEMLRASVKLMFKPEPLSISLLTLVIVAVTAVVKFGLGAYTMAMGRKVGSGALEALGLDSRNDSFISLVTIASAVVFLVWGLSIDAYAGAFTALVIIKSGFEVLRSTVSELLGRPGERELAMRLYEQVRGTPGVIGAADMMLHNYGPGAWSGSVNVEIDHEVSVGDIYRTLHALQLKIMHEEKVTMVFGVYAVDNDHEEVKRIRKAIGSFVHAYEGAKGFHAIYLDPPTGKLYCDIVVDYSLKDWEGLRTEFLAYMKEAFPEHEVVLTIETEFV